MSRAIDEIARLIEDAGADGTFGLPVAGRSLSPLLRPGDSVDLRRCRSEDLRRGDLALVRRGGVWSVRVVVALRPLRTALLRERAAQEPGEVHARVVALRRGGRTLRFGAGLRGLAWALQRALGGEAARALRPLVRRLRDAAPARALRERRLGPLRIRRVEEVDAPALDRFAAENLARVREVLAARLRGGWRTDGVPLGAFDGRGRLFAFAALDEYRRDGVALPGYWVRMLAVDPRARRLGLGRELVAALCAEAAARGIGPVRADVSDANEPSLRLFRGTGFREAPEELAALANALLPPPPEGGRWVVLEKASETAG